MGKKNIKLPEISTCLYSSFSLPPLPSHPDLPAVSPITGQAHLIPASGPLYFLFPHPDGPFFPGSSWAPLLHIFQVSIKRLSHWDTFSDHVDKITLLPHYLSLSPFDFPLARLPPLTTFYHTFICLLVFHLSLPLECKLNSVVADIFIWHVVLILLALKKRKYLVPKGPW